MLKLFELLFYGHAHKWNIIDKREVHGETWEGGNGLIGTRFTCQCTHCGKIKTFKNYNG